MIPEDRCVRHLVKNMGRGMPEIVVTEDQESMNSLDQDITKLRFGLRNQDPAKDNPPTPTSLCQWREGLGCRKRYRLRNSAACGCRWRRTWHLKAHFNASAASVLGTRSVIADTHAGASRVVASITPADSLACGNSLSAVAAGNHTANYRDCVKWKEAKAAVTKQVPVRA